MARMIAVFEVNDYTAWKARFDSDPVGRDETAIGYEISRSTQNPRQILLSIEFENTDSAEALLERLANEPPPPDADEMTVTVPPTVFETIDSSAP